MKGKILLFLSLMFAFIDNASAQDIKVSGTVKDERGISLPGVSVLVKGTDRGTSTNESGNFSINAATGSTITFSMLNMKPYAITVSSTTANSPLTIILTEDATSLSQVVVVGYGTQKKSDITGSISLIGKKDIESRPNTQFGNLIQGKTTGVQVISPSGKPSQGFSMRIRGTSSISSSSEPLYVVDGVPTLDTRSLNPADIEDISILKDASASAIYGAQGGNGVVLITTKRGKAGKTNVTFDAYTGISTVWRKLDVLDATQYKTLMAEIGLNTDWTQYTANTNWQDEVFRNGSSQNYQLNISGGNDKTLYYIGGGWSQNQGAVRSSDVNRANFKINLDHSVTDWLKVGTNLAYTRYHDVSVNDNQAVNQGGVLLGVLTTPPVIGIYNADGTFTRNPFQDWENPIASTDGTDRGYKNQRMIGNAYTEINFIPGLKYRSSFGIDYSNAVSDSFQDPIRTGWGRANGGIGTYGTNLSNYWIADNTLSYTKKINSHNFSVLAGYILQKYRWEDSSIERRGFSGTAVTTPNGGSTVQSASATKAEKANQSVISRINYDFDGKYLFTANFRADNSSNFGPGNRWGYFPSFSAGWRISQEPFLKDVKFINDLKIRAGWGIVGNDNIGSYAYLARVGVSSSYPIGGVILPGTYPASIGNSDLRWEGNEQTNIAIDISALNSRVNFTAEAYIKKTNNMLLNVPIPYSTGFSSGVQNVGSLENRGLEFLLNTKNFTGKFKWETDLNISFNRNKVLNLVGQQLTAGGVASRGDAVQNREGEPLGMFYGYRADVVDPITGNLFYLNANGNSTFTPNPATDRVFIGNPNPDFIYGITNNFSYKDFSLNIFLQGSQGNDVLNATRIETEAMEGPKNQSAAVLARWMKTGEVTNIPRSGNSNNSLISTRFIEDGSYMRVKAATLTYQLPSSLLSKVKISRARFYVTGENLFTITNYKGFDPEVNYAGGSNTVQGIDFGTYPQTRNLIFGLNVSF